MRKSKLTFFFVSIGLSILDLHAADFHLRVLDANGNGIANAKVEATPNGSIKPVTVFTSNTGRAVVTLPDDVRFHLRVTAPGIGVTEADEPASSEPERNLELRVLYTPPPQVITVTAVGIPVESEESGAPTETLDAQQLVNMQPTTAADALRFVPGAIVATSGQRGGQASLFVRGGDSRYNKVLIDGVPSNDPGGTFDFGTLPMEQFDRVEFVRGPESSLYGSDAMTSTVQFFTRAGSTLVPELRLSADGGDLGSAHGSGSLAGAFRRLDYNFYGDQFNTTGEGPNDDYSNSSEGANVGFALSHGAALRAHLRHFNSLAGVQNEWWFNGYAPIPPDQDQFVRETGTSADVTLSFNTGKVLQHTLTGSEFHHTYDNGDLVDEPARTTPFGDQDFSFHYFDDLNRAGFRYQGIWSPIESARTTFGYSYDNENGYDNDLIFGGGVPLLHALRRNHTAFAEEFVTWKRLSVLAGGSYVHNEDFGTRWIPRAAVTYLIFRGRGILSGTRLRSAYGQGVKEPRFEETFGTGAYNILPNPHLRPEQNRSVEVGITQGMAHDRLFLSATYFNQQFTDQIAFEVLDYTAFQSQYVNLNRTLAHGAELETHARLTSRTSLDASYFYTSTQILSAPQSADPLQSAGAPLLRRPKHAGTLLLDHVADRWGANVGGSFVGRRPDEDFFGYNITHAAGYATVNVGGWYRLNHYATAYLNIENALDKRYNEVLGYPALPINFRAGMRFTVGGER